MEDRHESVGKREEKERGGGNKQSKSGGERGKSFISSDPGHRCRISGRTHLPNQATTTIILPYPGSPRPKPSHPSEQGNGGVKEEDKRICEGRGLAVAHLHWNKPHQRKKTDPTGKKKTPP